ncbi:ParB/RepB/Spo0J family partition protein [Spirillospora sp. NBC_00431]
MDQAGVRPLVVAAEENGTGAEPGRRREIIEVPILSLRPGDSPRLKGEDKAHVMRLVETEQPLPPIIVDRRTMQVIDGIHRLMAASLKGQATIAVEFFEGSPEEAFLLGVQANVRHGLPLSQADRRAAALRILISHPDMSDRSIAESVGLGTRAVAEMRRSTDAVPELNARVGRDGKTRPLNGVEGRLRAAELISQNPTASLRHVARVAGVSPTTALDVRRRLERGEAPVPAGRGARAAEAAGKPEPVPEVESGSRSQVPAMALEKLLRDPSLRHNEQGRRLLRLLQETVSGAKSMRDIAAAVPSHCLPLVAEIAWRNSQIWQDFAGELDKRLKIANPLAERRLNGRAVS